MSDLPFIDSAIELMLRLDDFDRSFVLQDVPRWKILTCDEQLEDAEYVAKTYRSRPEFRSLIQYRFGILGEVHGRQDVANAYAVASAGMPSWGYIQNLYLSCKDIGPGLYIEHGFSTIVYAHSIGKNFFLNQNVTVGSGRDGYPTIGDDVSIRTHAVVIGGVRIGSNVRIGAGAVVTTDILSNSTVVPQKSRIITRT